MPASRCPIVDDSQLHNVIVRVLGFEPDGVSRAELYELALCLNIAFKGSSHASRAWLRIAHGKGNIVPRTTLIQTPEGLLKVLSAARVMAFRRILSRPRPIKEA
jgi:hypothetical protein